MGRFAGIRRFAKLWKDQKAATAVEYGLIVSCIVIAMMASFSFLATTVTEMWNFVAIQVLGA